MTHVMILLLLLAWFVFGAVTMVVVAALGRAGRMQDKRRAVAVRRAAWSSGERTVVARAA